MSARPWRWLPVAIAAVAAVPAQTAPAPLDEAERLERELVAQTAPGALLVDLGPSAASAARARVEALRRAGLALPLPAAAAERSALALGLERIEGRLGIEVERRRDALAEEYARLAAQAVPHGAPRLARLLADYDHQLGEADVSAQRWLRLAERWPAAAQLGKRCLVHAQAARVLLNQARRPVDAERLLARALAELADGREWSLVAAAELAHDADLFLVLPDRPLAASYFDVRGELRNLLAFAKLQQGRAAAALDDLAAAAEDFVATANTHRAANVDHNRAMLWLQLGDLDRAELHAAAAAALYADARLVTGGVDHNGLRAMEKVGVQAMMRRDPIANRDRALAIVRGWREWLPRAYNHTIADGFVVVAETVLATPGPYRDDEQELLRFCWDQGLGRPWERNNRPLQARLLQLQALAAAGAGEVAAARERLAAAGTAVAMAPEADLRVRQALATAEVELAADEPAAALVACAAAAAAVEAAIDEQRLWAFGGTLSTYQDQYRRVLQLAVRAYRRLAATDAARAGEVSALLYRVLQRFHGCEAAAESLALEALQVGESTADAETANLRARIDASEAELATLQRQAVAGGLLAHVQRRRLATAARRLDDLRRELRLAAVARQGRGVAPAEWSQVQRTLLAGEVCIEWLDLGTDIAAAVSTPDELAIVVCPDADAVLRAAGSAAEPGILAGDRRPELAAALGAALFEPLARWLEGARCVIHSPAGRLARVPFAALPWRGVPTAGRWHTVGIASGSALVALRARPFAAPPRGRLLALGNPRLGDAAATIANARRSANLDPRHLTALPATAAEVLAAARLFADADELPRLQLAGPPADFDGELRGRRFTAWLGAAATEQALRAADLRDVGFLHLACHGLADPKVAELSCLVLAPSGHGAERDGLVRAADLAGLRGDYELVALSACDSGDGPMRHGEGQASLARAALAIGARRALATLWQVEDGAAATLVVDFYRGWLVEGAGAAAALAAAQRRAAERGVPAREWAAFVLWGEPR